MADFKALCAELLAAADEYAGMNPYMRLDNAMKAARAALAAEPVPPDAGEVAELVEWLHGQDGGIARRAIYSRIADLLSRLAKPVPVGPTQDEIMSLAYEYFTFRGNSHRDSFFATSIEAKKDPCASLDDFARAVLARWRQPVPQPVPQPGLEELTNQEIESWAAASSVPGEFLDPDSGRWERCLSSEEFCATVRAALAFWGQP